MRSAAKATLVTVAGSGRLTPQPRRPRERERLALFTSRLEARVSSLLDDNGVPGMSVVLIRNGEIAWQRGFGRAHAGSARRVDEATIFEAQSMSKPVFAHVVMKLAEDGVLDLERLTSTS